MNTIRKAMRYFSLNIRRFFDSNPFAVDCFGETKKELSRLSPEEKERIRKLIEEMPD